MTDTPRFCQYCGSPMEPDWQFCEHCGGKPAVETPPPDQAATVFHPRLEIPPEPARSDQTTPGQADPSAETVFHAPIQVPPAPPASKPPASTSRPATPQPKGKRRMVWLVPAGIGCFVVVCLCIVAVGAYFLWNGTQVSDLQTAPTARAEISPAATETPLEAESPTNLPPTSTSESPAPTQVPDPTEEPAPPDNDLTGNQYRDATSIFDDFSSKALGWEEYDDGTFIIIYEDEAYSFQITEQDYFDWTVAPVNFWPNAIQFDVWGLPGRQNGNYGVLCQFQDADNYNYVEVIPDERLFTIGTVRAGELTYQTIPDASGDYWLEAAPLKASPQEVNRFDVGCYRDAIVLAINDALVYHVDIPDPFPNPGEIALFIYTYPEAGPQGYKVFFDNVGVQQVDE